MTIARISRRILVVDDNVDAADCLALLLQLDGHDVRAVYGADDALTAVAQFAPEIVLLDIGLPQMDGYEVGRRLLETCRESPPRLVALTGYSRLEDQTRARAAGFSNHLVKPVSPDALDRILSS
jgi:CheY-like chemotaxis protein